jgi:hypothetical protein
MTAPTAAGCHLLMSVRKSVFGDRMSSTLRMFEAIADHVRNSDQG